MHYNLKGVFLLLLPIFIFASFNKDIIQLSKKPYWHILLHYKNQKSEIDSPSFFLSKNGKYSPYEELNATIYYLQHPKYQDDNSTYCRFPARREWIKEKFPNLDIKVQNCIELNKEMNAIKSVKSVSVIFPTILMNSPASMFGHTLLRLDDSNGDLLNSFAINYAAMTDDTNAIIYAFKGLTGMYKGKFAVVPYYKKISEYNDIKNRDIWEYKLNLTPNEIEKLKLHLFEVKDKWAYYYYFNKNCSYEILWFLEAARPSLELTNKFNYKTLPIDTIKEMDREHLIVSSNFRPSKRKIILYYYNHISNKSIASKFLKTNDVKLLKNLNTKDKQYILDFAIEMLNYDYVVKHMKQTKYLKKYIKLLKIRSKLGKEKTINVVKPDNPLNSHDSDKVWVYYKKDTALIGIKPAFHSIYDLNNGFVAGAYIDFFKLQASISKDSSKLDYFYFFNIKSLTPRDDIFKPISWSVDLGFERFRDNEMYATLKTSAGISYKINRFLYSFDVNLKHYYKNSYYLGIAPEIYCEYNFEVSKFVFDFQRNFFDFKKYNELNIRYIQGITKQFNINVGYSKDINQNNFFVGINYYFL